MFCSIFHRFLDRPFALPASCDEGFSSGTHIRLKGSRHGEEEKSYLRESRGQSLVSRTYNSNRQKAGFCIPFGYFMGLKNVVRQTISV